MLFRSIYIYVAVYILFRSRQLPKIRPNPWGDPPGMLPGMLPGRAELSRAEPSRALPPSPPYRRSRCMFFLLFSTPPTRNAYFSDHFPSLPSFLTPSFPPSLPNRRSRYMFFATFFNTSHTKHLLLDLFHNFPVPNLSTFTS